MAFRAFTLIEVLVVTAVFCILAGLLYPAIVRAKEQGYRAADLSQMRQVAAAGAMYSDQFGEYPFRVEQLVNVKILEKRISKLALDPYPEGLEAHYLKSINTMAYLSASCPDYPQSFITVGDFGFGGAQMAEILRRSDPGWAIAGIHGNLASSSNSFWGDRYYRIGIDGSIRQLPVPLVYGFDKATRTKTRTIRFRDFFGDQR
jgi:prepilin-type N-terminal cleavage/methylation domain-containing protein